VVDEKKMKNLSSEMRAAKDLERHKERMMKKNMQTTPMTMKKVLKSKKKCRRIQKK
jgi:hypothetical protein